MKCNIFYVPIILTCDGEGKYAYILLYAKLEYGKSSIFKTEHNFYTPVFWNWIRANTADTVDGCATVLGGKLER